MPTSYLDLPIEVEDIIAANIDNGKDAIRFLKFRYLIRGKQAAIEAFVMANRERIFLNHGLSRNIFSDPRFNGDRADPTFVPNKKEHGIDNPDGLEHNVLWQPHKDIVYSSKFNPSHEKWHEARAELTKIEEAYKKWIVPQRHSRAFNTSKYDKVLKRTWDELCISPKGRMHGLRKSDWSKSSTYSGLIIKHACEHQVADAKGQLGPDPARDLRIDLRKLRERDEKRRLQGLDRYDTWEEVIDDLETDSNFLPNTCRRCFGNWAGNAYVESCGHLWGR